MLVVKVDQIPLAREEVMLKHWCVLLLDSCWCSVPKYTVSIREVKMQQEGGQISMLILEWRCETLSEILISEYTE